MVSDGALLLSPHTSTDSAKRAIDLMPARLVGVS